MFERLRISGDDADREPQVANDVGSGLTHVPVESGYLPLRIGHLAEQFGKTETRLPKSPLGR